MVDFVSSTGGSEATSAHKDLFPSNFDIGQGCAIQFSVFRTLKQFMWEAVSTMSVLCAMSNIYIISIICEGNAQVY